MVHIESEMRKNNFSNEVSFQMYDHSIYCSGHPFHPDEAKLHVNVRDSQVRPGFAIWIGCDSEL